MTNNDNKFMNMALALAKKGGKRVFLNPLVGCIIVNDGRIIGKGYHEYFGGKHAEINAIESSKGPLKGASLYVNLEPCSHWGKTPPCTEKIISCGIGRVIIAMKDPNPKVSGNGIRALKKAGIKVDAGLLQNEALKINKRYIQGIINRKSKVIVKFAMTLDGKIASKTGDSKWISSKTSRQFVHKLRAKIDGIVVGINTVLKDDPELTSHGEGRDPARIVIDPQLKIPLKSKLLDTRAPTIIFCSESSDKVKQHKLINKGAILERALTLKGRINFKYIINKLSNMSIYKVLVEGGGNTIAEALNSGVVDQIYAFIAPKVLGGRFALSPVEGSGSNKISDSILLEKMSSKWIGNDLLIIASVKR
jgi:diaminohydroxyphosphoribosylaminopyrimidine deaminase/5-amino-6-(5-phosphoribosylamino)uracil reductase